MSSDPACWQDLTVGDVARFENRLRVPLSGAQRDERPGPYPYWGANGVIDYVDDFLFEGTRILVGEDGTVRRSDGRAVVHWVSGRFWVNNHAHVLWADESCIEPRWLYYALCNATVDPFITGAVQPKLSMRQLRKVPLLVPSIEEQRRIASVLSALDDKVKSNERLAKDLIELVAVAYRHAITGPDVSTMRLGELGAVRGGGTPHTKVREYWEPGEVVWVTPKDMTALTVPFVFDSERRISGEGLASSSAKLLPRGSVLYTSRATLGHVAIAAVELATNQGFIAVEPSEELSAAFVLMTLRHCNEAIVAKANGSTFLEVNKTNFKAVECVRPQPEALRDFDAVAKPALDKVAALEQESVRIRGIRDALLSRLLSGEMRVADTELSGDPVA